METIVYILITILIIAVVYLIIKIHKKDYNSLVIPNGAQIIFQGSINEPDWVIKRVNNQLITGIKSGNTVIQKSVI